MTPKNAPEYNNNVYNSKEYNNVTFSIMPLDMIRDVDYIDPSRFYEEEPSLATE